MNCASVPSGQNLFLRGSLGLSLLLGVALGLPSTTHALNTSINRIRAPQVHAAGHIGFSADVGVIDTGVGVLSGGNNHPSIVSGPSIITRMDFTGSGTADDNYNPNPAGKGGHGTHVAGIVASNNATYRGVAPAADILAAKVFAANGTSNDTWILNGVEWARTQGADVINMSLGGFSATSNGNDDQLQKYLDYLVDNPTHDASNDTMNEPVTLVLSAGNGSRFSGAGAIPTTPVGSPGSAYNGITVGASTNNFLNATPWTSRRGNAGKGLDNQWGRAGVDDDGNGIIDDASDFGAPASDDTFADNANLRSKPDLVAPGTDIMSTNNDWGPTFTGSATAIRREGNDNGNSADGDDDGFDFVQLTGTSMAAPHVSGAAAVLYDIGINTPGLLQMGTPAGAQVDHKVIKSVLLTGTDKMSKNPSAAGVTRDSAGNVWSAVSAFQPLDDTLGAGQLDLVNAVDIYEAGEQNPTSESNLKIDEKGWDINKALTPFSHGDIYSFKRRLYAGTWITATLVWDRHVNWIDTDNDNTVEFTDTFNYVPLDRLGLTLWYDHGGPLENGGVFSASMIDNVQHIHYQIGATGFYSLGVSLDNNIDFSGEVYGLAWSAQFIPEPATLTFILAAVVGCGLCPWRHRRG